MNSKTLQRNCRRNCRMTKLFVYFCSVLALLCSAAWSAGQDGTPGKTWKTLAELSAAEKAEIDLSTDTPRDSQIPYLPAERFPFSPPYTAEEMGLRSMEYPHTPYWNLTLIDIGITITNTGFLDQRVSIIPTLYLPSSFTDQLYHVPAGQDVFRWLSQAVAPPERYGNQSLFIGYRSDQHFTTKLDMFAYTPSLRRIRRQPQPRRDDRMANSAQTIDDLIGRDAWEFSWKILGTDTLYQRNTVRFPVTRASAMLTDD